MKKLFLVMVVLAMVSVLASSAFASVSTVGNPFPVGSWAQEFNESGVGNFNYIQFNWISGEMFEYVGSFSDGSWAQTGNNGKLLTAAGNTLTSLNFKTAFMGASSSPLAFNFSAWNGNTLQESVKAVWNGGAWSFTVPGNPVVVQSVVPEPMSIMLGIMGLGSVAGFKRLRRS